MIYSWCTFLDCYSVFSLLQAYFLPTDGNGEVPVLGKLPYERDCEARCETICSYQWKSERRLYLKSFEVFYGMRRQNHHCT
jgi:hypothetical protein